MHSPGGSTKCLVYKHLLNGQLRQHVASAKTSSIYGVSNTHLTKYAIS